MATFLLACALPYYSCANNNSILLSEVCHEKPSMPSVLKRLYRFRDAGHSLCFVSEYQKTLYDRMAKRQTYDAKFVEIDSYINSAYVTGSKPKLVEPEYDCCTIGRCDIEKKPFLMKTLLIDTKIRNLLMTNTPPSNCKPHTYSYYKKNFIVFTKLI